MQRGAKVNWFESPHLMNGIWALHHDRNDTLKFPKSNASDNTVFLTPSRNSKPMSIQKSQGSPYQSVNHIIQSDSSRFDDISLPDMFANTRVEKGSAEDKDVINQKLNFEDSEIINQDEEFMTPQKQIIDRGENYKNNLNFLADTTAKKSHFHLFEEKKTRPKQKGLRKLSQKAYEIVLKLNGATYKQVANILVGELADEDNVDIDEKDEQNIKRRVYDALNVLIALGVLKKKDRRIYGDSPLQRKSIEEFKKEQSELQKNIELKKFRIEDKRKQQKNLIQRATLIKSLIARNQKQGCDSAERIQFPFIGIDAEGFKENKSFVNGSSAQIELESKEYTPFGDLDSLPYFQDCLKPFLQ